MQIGTHFHDSIHPILANTTHKVKCLRSKEQFFGAIFLPILQRKVRQKAIFLQALCLWQVVVVVRVEIAMQKVAHKENLPTAES